MNVRARACVYADIQIKFFWFQALILSELKFLPQSDKWVKIIENEDNFID